MIQHYQDTYLENAIKPYKKFPFFSESLRKNSKKEETEKLIEQIRIERERDRAAMKRQQEEKEQHEKNVVAKNHSSGIYLLWKKLKWTKIGLATN